MANPNETPIFKVENKKFDWNLVNIEGDNLMELQKCSSESDMSSVISSSEINNICDLFARSWEDKSINNSPQNQQDNTVKRTYTDSEVKSINNSEQTNKIIRSNKRTQNLRNSYRNLDTK
jgi:hypothetical protein